LDDFPKFDTRSGFLKLGKDWTIRVDFVAGHAGQDKPQLQPFEVLLPLQRPVDGDENVKLIPARKPTGDRPCYFANQFRLQF
jgi:hypothetical protein